MASINSTRDEMVQETQTGPRLMSLPPELRTLIFKYVLAPRIVPIYAMSLSMHPGPPKINPDDLTGSETYKECMFTTPHCTPLHGINRATRSFVTSKSQTKNSIEEFLSISSREAHFSFKTYTHPTPVTGFLLPHCISYPDDPKQYSQGFRYFERAVPRDEGSRNFSFVDPEVDVFFLKDHYLFPRSAIDTMVRWLDEHLLRNLRRLALSYRTWKKAVVEQNLVALRELTGLKKLYVVVSWDDVLDELGVFNREWIKDDVRENMDWLVSGDLGWKPPTLTFVNDEGSLGEMAGLERAPKRRSQGRASASTGRVL